MYHSKIGTYSVPVITMMPPKSKKKGKKRPQYDDEDLDYDEPDYHDTQEEDWDREDDDW